MSRITMKQYTIFYIGVWENLIEEGYAIYPVTFVTALINRVNIFLIGSLNVLACFNLVTIFVRWIIKAARLASNEFDFNSAKCEN